jgi:hypothetical protein
MDQSTLLTAQLTDVFRIGLLAALLFTTEKTRSQTGVVLPLLAGIVFVAVVIATTMPVAGVSQMQAIISGLFANALLAGIMWFGWSLVKKRL